MAKGWNNMNINRLDHLVLTVTNIEKTCDLCFITDVPMSDN